MIHIFIINSHAGKNKFSVELRNHLAGRNDIKYYILHTRLEHNETQLVREVMELFEEETVRIYSCGGSGTVCNILNGISDFSKVEVAFYPKGLTNDFLKVFGKDGNAFSDIDALIDGKAVPIDYIQSNHGVCLNSFSVGLDTIQVKKLNEFRPMNAFGRGVPYAMGFIYAVLWSKAYSYEVTVDGTTYKAKMPEIYFGNGGVIGGNLWFEAETDIRDGSGRVMLFKDMNRIDMIHTLSGMTKKKTPYKDKLWYNGHAKSISLRRTDGAPFTMDFDGNLQNPQVEWSAHIVEKGLNFVIPKGVRLDEGND